MAPDLDSRRSRGNGLAVVCLILGILACICSVILVGSLIGLVGALLGVIHLFQRKPSNGLAWTGIGFSLMGIVLSVVFLVFYIRVVGNTLEAFLKEINRHQSSQVAENVDWKGVIAPELTLTTIDGKTVTLSELKGKRVILDFWATWCGPCRAEIPHFLKLHEEFSEELVIIGISDEESSVIKEFAEEHKITYLMVSSGDLPAPFDQIDAFPTTFVIDRQGVIQDILVGYHDYEVLKSHATGADYTGVAKTAPEMPKSSLVDSPDKVTLSPAWTVEDVEGASLSVADWDANGTDDILVVGYDDKLRIVSLDGKVMETVDLPEDTEFATLGRHPQGPRLLAYSNWGTVVTVLDRKGTTVWAYPSEQGVNGAHWGDLDGDGIDEMIVGMNGNGGLHAVSGDGAKLWQVTAIGNVWNQAIISATATSAARVFVTEANGTVQIYDSKGELLKTLNPLGNYFSSMAAHRDARDGAIQIVVSRDVTAALDEEGTVAWSTPAKEADSNWRAPTFASGDINGDGIADWAFIDITNELVIVNLKGAKLTTLPQQRDSDAFAIARDSGGKGLLLILEAGELRALRAE
ncbi:MAG: cytochrome biosis protein [Schlesneria sp.]|nr:cytochrome biosis protein [Schlesneria sp.]